MATYGAEIRWRRDDAERFTDRRYSRAHAWHFDGGAVVAASASPHHVPLPFARPEHVDPEEAFVAAIASCHPVIEVVQWRIPGWESASPMLKLADSIGHGALILGEAIADWQSIDFATLTGAQEITGAPVKHATGNPAGDMIRLIAWLADEGAVWSGGLRAGQIVTCGSWTGALPAPAGGTATTHFAGTQPVRVSFSAA